MEPTPELIALMAEWYEARPAAKAATEHEDRVKNAIRGVLGEHAGAECDAWKVTHKLGKGRSTTDWKAVAAEYRARLEAFETAMGGDEAWTDGRGNAVAAAALEGTRGGAMDVAQNTLLPLEHRPIELGRIRLGSKSVSKNGKQYPVKLEHWRLTSASKAYLEAAAALYGGTVQAWADAPDEGYFEVFTESTELRILIPTSLRTVSQSYELWQGGTCERRCDGTYEQYSGGPCLCDPGARECEPMTRVSVMLPDIPGLGVWRLDTGGWHAATSIPATIELLKQLSAQPWIPAILRLEQRSKKVREDGKVVTHRFAVPVLDLPGLTVGKVVARMGNAEAPRIEAPRPEMPTAAERAIEKAAAIKAGAGGAEPSGESVGLRPAPTAGQGEDQAAGNPPPRPVDTAGARPSTPGRSSGSDEAGHPSDGASMPAPDTDARCLEFSPVHGRCVADFGHSGPHQDEKAETWT
jgi:hypothetical protein